MLFHTQGVNRELLLDLSNLMLPTQDDGYLSEGGASFYARKIQSRIALEKQKEVEEQRNRLLLGGGGGGGQQGRAATGAGGGLPEVLGGAGGLQRGEREHAFLNL